LRLDAAGTRLAAGGHHLCRDHRGGQSANNNSRKPGETAINAGLKRRKRIWKKAKAA